MSRECCARAGSVIGHEVYEICVNTVRKCRSGSDTGCTTNDLPKEFVSVHGHSFTWGTPTMGSHDLSGGATAVDLAVLSPLHITVHLTQTVAYPVRNPRTGWFNVLIVYASPPVST